MKLIDTSTKVLIILLVEMYQKILNGLEQTNEEDNNFIFGGIHKN